MARENIASPGSRLFANKGTAQPASGLRSIHPEVEPDEDPQIPAVPAKSGDSLQRAPGDSEFADAASLQAGGFKTADLEDPAPPARDTVEPDTGEVSQELRVSNMATAGPADIETALAEAASPSTEVAATRTSALLARSATLHPLVVATAFAALLLASLGIGYGISIIARGGPAEDGAVAPADAVRSQAPRSLPSNATAR